MMTIRGFVTGEIRAGVTDAGVAFANFRMGASDRFRDQQTNEWRDGHTNWYDVKAYRSLAANITCSLNKGERVLVTGRLRVRDWTDRNGNPRTAVELLAESVGHDLMFGTARFMRGSQQARGAEAGGGAGGGMEARQDGGFTGSGAMTDNMSTASTTAGPGSVDPLAHGVVDEGLGGDEALDGDADEDADETEDAMADGFDSSDALDGATGEQMQGAPF